MNIEMRLYGDVESKRQDIDRHLSRAKSGDSFNRREEVITLTNGSKIYFRVVAKPTDSDRMSGMIWHNTFLHSSLTRVSEVWSSGEIGYLLSRQRGYAPTKPERPACHEYVESFGFKMMRDGGIDVKQ